MPTVNIFGMLSERRNAAIPRLCEAAMPPRSSRQQEDTWPEQAGPCPSGYPFALRVQVPPIDQVELALKIHQMRLKQWCARKGRRLPPPLEDSLKLVFDEWFQMLDAGQAGQLGRDQVADSMNLSGAAPYQEQAVSEMLELLDLDDDGKVDWAEFRHFLNSEVAAGKDVLNSEFVLPSGRTLPLAPVLAVMRRKKMMCDIMANKDGQARADWAAKSGEVLEAITTKREDLEKAMMQQQIQRLRDLKKTITMRSRQNSMSFSEVALAASRRFDSRHSQSSSRRASSARGSPLNSPRGGTAGSGTGSPRPGCLRVTATSESGMLSPRLAATSYNTQLRVSGTQVPDGNTPSLLFEGQQGIALSPNRDQQYTGPPKYELLLKHVDKMLLAYEMRMMGKRVPMPEPVLAKSGPRTASASSTGRLSTAGGMTPGQAIAARGSHGQVMKPEITHSAQWAGSLRPGESLVEARARPAGAIVKPEVIAEADDDQPTILEYRKPQRTESKGRSTKPSIRESMGLEPRKAVPSAAAAGSTPVVPVVPGSNLLHGGTRLSADGFHTRVRSAPSRVAHGQDNPTALGAPTTQSQDNTAAIGAPTGQSTGQSSNDELPSSGRRSAGGTPSARASSTGAAQSRLRPVSALPVGVPRLMLHTMPASTMEAGPLSPAQESLMRTGKNSCREGLSALGFESAVQPSASTTTSNLQSTYTIRPRPRSACVKHQHTWQYNPATVAVHHSSVTHKSSKAGAVAGPTAGSLPAHAPSAGSLNSWTQSDAGVLTADTRRGAGLHGAGLQGAGLQGDEKEKSAVSGSRTAVAVVQQGLHGLQRKQRPWSCLPARRSDINSFLASCGPREEGAVVLKAITEACPQPCALVSMESKQQYAASSSPRLEHAQAGTDNCKHEQVASDSSVAWAMQHSKDAAATSFQQEVAKTYGVEAPSILLPVEEGASACLDGISEDKNHALEAVAVQQESNTELTDESCSQRQGALQAVAKQLHASAGQEGDGCSAELSAGRETDVGSCMEPVGGENCEDPVIVQSEMMIGSQKHAMNAKSEDHAGACVHVVNVQTPRQQAAAAAITRMMARSKPTDWQLSQAHAARLL